MDLSLYSNLYKKELLANVIPFWERHSIDRESGGYFTCLDREGEVFDTDKFIWLQARQVYLFSKLYLEVEPRQEWLDMALHGANFLEERGRNEDGDWYFSLDRQGIPQVDAYNVFSDCFAALAFGTLYRISDDPKHRAISIDTFERILKRQDNPKKHYNKSHPSARKSRNFALPMIICNLAQELSDLLDRSSIRTLQDKITHTIMNDFFLESEKIVIENIGSDGQFMDTFDGRLVNPGHAIEAMWFVMDYGYANNDLTLVKTALSRAHRMMEYGWDEKYGGIFYFMDVKGHPPQQLEWDQKLWWPHLEALICLAKGIEYLEDEKSMVWFEKIHEYTWNHFRDPSFGEWFGYLNRRGEVLLPLKGGKWKGCFHVPRALLLISTSLEKAGGNQKLNV